jgi:hypothetical protein
MQPNLHIPEQLSRSRGFAKDGGNARDRQTMLPRLCPYTNN